MLEGELARSVASMNEVAATRVRSDAELVRRRPASAERLGDRSAERGIA